ncbi:hypothetical protein OH76DRAFT_1400869 [Lentinus brumalis]|uniref:Uncharacterized protein n=1 Tax=Lentinus brumalis TaxID=2498619 RepID=A0A371DHE8_9APHY|nr:hypothetical protein OH76DRAFT_1400869 [Polyporus brumalis]
MSRSRALPLLVAGVTGVLSGVYIFKPLFDQSSGRATARSIGTGNDVSAGSVQPPAAAERSSAAAVAQSNTNPDTVNTSGVAEGGTSNRETRKH